MLPENRREAISQVANDSAPHAERVLLPLILFLLVKLRFICQLRTTLEKWAQSIPV